MSNNNQIEELRKKYKDNMISYDEIGMLFNVIDVLDRKSKQDNETIKYYLNSQYGKEVTNKVQLSSLYGIHKERHKNVDIYIIIKDTKTGTSDIDFKNVNVEIKDKFIEVYNGTRYFNYNINEVVFYELRDSIDREYIENDNKIIQDYIKNNDKIESEVE